MHPPHSMDLDVVRDDEDLSESLIKALAEMTVTPLVWKEGDFSTTMSRLRTWQMHFHIKISEMGTLRRSPD